MIRDPEFNLLVELCAAAIRGEPAPLGESHDWQRLLRLARRHRVEGLVWLASSGGTQPEQAKAFELLQDAKSIARKNLLAVAAAKRLVDAFFRDRLALVFVKGLTLAALSYRHPMLKTSTDIDVLVDPAEIDEVERCLLGLGYRPEGELRGQSRRNASAKEWTWSGDDQVVLDLHVRLADNPALLPAISARSRTRDVEVAPDVFLPTLNTEDLFAYLCVHGTSSAWFRLKWAADLAAFLHARRPAEIRALRQAAASRETGRCVDVALLVVERLFGPLAGEDLLHELSHDPITRVLTALSLRELLQEREPLDRRLGTVLIHVGQLFIDRGWVFPIREFRRQFSNLMG